MTVPMESEGEEYYLFAPTSDCVREYIRANNLLNKFFYNDFYRRAETSQAHARFCELAYGRTLADMQQIDALNALLAEQNAQQILDIGCGDGYITEYIAGQIKAQVTGIDIADDAIERAQQRAQSWHGQLSFQVMDIAHLNLAPESFDTILSIDSLYFVGQLTEVIKNCKRC